MFLSFFQGERLRGEGAKGGRRVRAVLAARGPPAPDEAADLQAAREGRTRRALGGNLRYGDCSKLICARLREWCAARRREIHPT